MADRFYHPGGFDGTSLELDGGEFHHLARVLRKRVGDAVTLFDGEGSQATAVIQSIGKRSATLKVLSVEPLRPRPRPAITIAACVPKGERFRWLVEKTAELGVQRFVPLITERSVVDPGRGKLDKARQWVVEAAKQSGTLHTMDVAEPRTWREFVDRLRSSETTVIAHPAGGRLIDIVPPGSSPQALTFAVGPEGGFTEDEIALARESAATAVDLGETILRMETAAVALAAYARLAVGATGTGRAVLDSRCGNH